MAHDENYFAGTFFDRNKYTEQLLLFDIHFWPINNIILLQNDLSAIGPGDATEMFRNWIQIDAHFFLLSEKSAFYMRPCLRQLHIFLL